MRGFTYREFIKLQLDNGLYRVGFHTSKFIDKINQKLVRVLCDDWHTDLEEGDIIIEDPNIQSLALKFRPVRKKGEWYQIFGDNIGWVKDDMGLPIRVRSKDLPVILTKLENNQYVIKRKKRRKK